jgi:hypothetical protein
MNKSLNLREHGGEVLGPVKMKIGDEITINTIIEVILSFSPDMSDLRDGLERSSLIMKSNQS